MCFSFRNMIQIGDKIISRDIFEKHFHCDLGKCKGSCCVFGDSGAPLKKAEAEMLDRDIDKIQPYMTKEGWRAVKEQGRWVVDRDGDRVTPLVNREECAYVVFGEGIAWCAIERAYMAGSVTLRKPASCHLYPIRVSRLKGALALNYHQWSICEPARILGKEKDLVVFRFLKEALTRVFGKEFYEELERVYSELKKQEILNK